MHGIQQDGMKTRFLVLDVICIAVLCVILTLGLWPFHSPENGVTWLKGHNGVRFRKYGMLISARVFPIMTAESGASASVEVWLKPRRIWDHGTLLGFYTPENLYQFSLRQSETTLEIRAENSNESHHLPRFYIQNVFSNPSPYS